MKKLLLLCAVLLTTLAVSAENYILYTTSNGEVVTPYEYAEFGANLVTNTYENGQGKMLFDGEVIKIGMDAFYQCSNLTSVEIPASVTEIEIQAFHGCSGLTSVTIPDAVTACSGDAFVGCTNLGAIHGKSASDDNRCLIIDGTLVAFAPAGLTTYAIPESVTAIGHFVFENCSDLTSVTIPESVTEIGWYAF